MVFLYPQFKHGLIPQAHSDAENLNLASKMKESRSSWFQLIQNKIEEFSSNYSGQDNQENLYQKIRRDLDACDEVQKANHRRSIIQDNLWQRVASDLEQDQPRLEKEYKYHLNRKGRLELNSSLDFPTHQLQTNIHRMPGGYLQDHGVDDFWLGAMYDHGVFLYGQGWLGSLNDELGLTLIHNILFKYYPEFTPQRILDLGCSVGHSTLPYVSAYPQAEVWGIDIGASLLRYASARATALDKNVYFAQQNAEYTDFEDNSFDLIVSHILLHEIPGIARKRLFTESYRLLKPGGIMVHLDSKLFLSPPSLIAHYFRDTEVWANSEPYLASSSFDDFPKFILEVGFNPDDVAIRYVPGYYAEKNGNKNPGWLAFCAVKR